MSLCSQKCKRLNAAAWWVLVCSSVTAYLGSSLSEKTRRCSASRPHDHPCSSRIISGGRCLTTTTTMDQLKNKSRPDLFRCLEAKRVAARAFSQHKRYISVIQNCRFLGPQYIRNSFDSVFCQLGCVTETDADVGSHDGYFWVTRPGLVLCVRIRSSIPKSSKLGQNSFLTMQRKWKKTCEPSHTLFRPHKGQTHQPDPHAEETENLDKNSKIGFVCFEQKTKKHAWISKEMAERVSNQTGGVSWNNFSLNGSENLKSMMEGPKFKQMLNLVSNSNGYFISALLTQLAL